MSACNLLSFHTVPVTMSEKLKEFMEILQEFVWDGNIVCDRQ